MSLTPLSSICRYRDHYRTMSNGVFFLDEERERETTSDPSPTLSPSNPPEDTKSTQPLPSLQTPLPSLIVPIPTPAGQPLPQHRKHPASFAATPSFPSPLARAVTVPSHSDESSSSTPSSPTQSDEEWKRRRDSGQHSPSEVSGSGTPKRWAENMHGSYQRSPSVSRAGSPTSCPPSPTMAGTNTRPQLLTPGALLMRSRRSGSTSLQSPPRIVKKEPPTGDSMPRFVDTFSRMQTGDTNSVHSQSGSSGSVYDQSSSSKTEPASSGRPVAIPSAQDVSKEANSLGLGWGTWESSGSGSSFGNGTGSLRDKGKFRGDLRDIGPVSPRRERDRMCSFRYVIRNACLLKTTIDNRMVASAQQSTDGHQNSSTLLQKLAKCLSAMVDLHLAVQAWLISRHLRQWSHPSIRYHHHGQVLLILRLLHSVLLPVRQANQHRPALHQILEELSS